MKLVPKSPNVRTPGPASLLPGVVGDFKKPVSRSRTIRIDFRNTAIAPESLMDKFVIRGGNPLVGSVRISGAKNAALPAMAAAILTDEPVILENIPDVRDIQTERNLLVSMGAEVELGYGRASHRTTISCSNLANPEAAYELVKTMRASTLVLGPLVARMGRARVSQPGGCAIGARPIDLHIKGLERLGAKITQDHGYVEASTNRLKGAEIVFDLAQPIDDAADAAVECAIHVTAAGQQRLERSLLVAPT
jgi:UDP-N-acetylglucosamine enolpyruvyl transferase